MIDIFENTVQRRFDQVFFSFVDEQGKEESFTYRQTRLIAAQLARRLRERGVLPGDAVALDLPNCPMYVFLALAAGYGSFTLVALNYRLTSSEKRSRLAELDRCGMHVSCQIDRREAERLLDQVKQSLMRGVHGFRAPRDSVSVPGAPGAYAGRSGRGAFGGVSASQAAGLGGTVEDAIHFAERAAHTFDVDRLALIMFTSGTTGKSKATELTWRNLMESSIASNQVLAGRSSGRELWQAVLPFYHIGGFQVMVRSVCGRNVFRVYERFDAAGALRDAAVFHATHISVVDKMLQDLLDVNEGRSGSARESQRAPSSLPAAGTLARYECILLGGGPLNARTLERSLEAGARVYASYGMTETSSQIANTLVTPSFDGGLRLLPGYGARIVDADAQGFGSLAVRGPGIAEGYVNAQAPFTADGYFLTGDTAALFANRLYIRERTDDMFISGGENVYPAEIVAALLRVPGVTDAYVFGVPDARWGKRPVAVVEMPDARSSFDEQAIRAYVSRSLSKIYVPDRIVVVPQMPRRGIGKIDRVACEQLFAGLTGELTRESSSRQKVDRRTVSLSTCVDVRRVELMEVEFPFRAPFKTARGTLSRRKTLLVRVTDERGCTGLGECTSFETDWYLPETLAQDERVLEKILAPHVLSRVYRHPREVADDLASLPDAGDFPMARSALEMACWDLYGNAAGVPLWQMLQDEFKRMGTLGTEGNVPMRTITSVPNVPANVPVREAGEGRAAPGSSRADRRVSVGAVVGVAAPDKTLESVCACVQQGYRRVKLKIAPGNSAQSARAIRVIRQVFPSLLVTLDANRSFGPEQLAELRAFDALGIGWIEEPLDTRAFGALTCKQSLEYLSALQHSFATPLAVDESFTNACEAEAVLKCPDLRCIVVKVGKFGGIESALRFVRAALADGRRICMSGMYDTGVSRFVHAAFQTLPGMDVPGDLGAVSRYFDSDVTDPAYETAQGTVTLNGAGRETGIGCTLNAEVLAAACMRHLVVR